MLNLLIKPASGLCNMRCEYCFYHDEEQNRETAFKGIMTLDTAENLIKKAFAREKRGVLFAFQGGEPTLAGLEFFESFASLVEKYKPDSAQVNYSLQTNGLLIDENWAKFFKRYNFLIGLSCDGTKKIHDKFRCDNAGKPTYARVMNAVKIFDKFRVDYNVLTVVTAKTDVKKTYENLKKHGVRFMQFIPCLNPLGSDDVLPTTLSNDGYCEFIDGLFDLWFDDFKRGDYYSIRYFDNLFFMYTGGGSEQCGMQGHCNIQYVIEGNGDVYPCDFYCLDEYRLGNINTDDFATLSKSANAVTFLEHSCGFDSDCKTCECFKLCRSGCRRYKKDGKYIYCDAFKKFHKKLTERLPQIMSVLNSDLYR